MIRPTVRDEARRRGSVIAFVVGIFGLIGATGTTFAGTDASGSDASTRAADAEAIMALAGDVLEDEDLRAVIVRVTIDDDEIVTGAIGESMTGVPATVDMRFRNGAVAISYVATLALILVDEGVIGLDDTIDAWLPDLPDADEVTLRMLLDMTAGYPDHVEDEGFLDALAEDPFRAWTADELIAFSLAGPRHFAPGTNWAYSHSGYVILGKVLEAATGIPMATMMQERVLDPLGLTKTVGSATAAIPDPVLHAFSSERRGPLRVPDDTRFYEESTFWDPSWTITEGAVQTSDIGDLTTTAAAIGEGSLLSEASHVAQVSDHLIGFGSPVEGCRTCHTLDGRYAYGLGVVLSGSWLLQNPVLGGYASVAAYHPDERIAIAVATTFAAAAFDETGEYRHGNSADHLFRAIGSRLVPDDPPPP